MGKMSPFDYVWLNMNGKIFPNENVFYNCDVHYFGAECVWLAVNMMDLLLIAFLFNCAFINGMWHIGLCTIGQRLLNPLHSAVKY